MNDNIVDDLTSWKMLQDGDNQGIDFLYQRHYLLMLNFGLKLCANQEIVKDSIQDIFVKLHFAKNLSTPISPRSYLLKALRHTIYDKMNAQSKLTPLDQSVFDFSDKNAEHLEFFNKDDEDMDTMNRLSSAYSKLSTTQKQIIYLRYLKGISYNEIADIMDINRQSAMNSIQKSLKKLRSLMSSILAILNFLVFF